ncbi:MAG: MCE family protein [Candidatus Eremiobacteraeota bacterium]|nr:MCE family protein [Candidatus Eremiobacteraeota bacterium]MBC5826699.1 MCE family protein [Candidatus Eremiobacteraeota bacterium]
MSQQVKVGLFALTTIVGVFAAYFVLTNYRLNHGGYTIAVHFKDVGGLQAGSSVQLSGVIVGTVAEVRLLPDQTVDVLCTIQPGAIVYRGSSFLVATTLTGQATLVITPPRPLAGAAPLAAGILAENEQPEGYLPPSITDLATQGQTQLKELSKTVAVVNQELPQLARQFNAIASHTDTLIGHSDAALQSLASEFATTIGQVNADLALTQSVISVNGRNVSQLTGNVNSLVSANGEKVTRLVISLSDTATSLNKTMTGLSAIAQDPLLKTNVLQTTTNVKDASAKLKQIAGDIQGLTGDPQVQTQLRGAVFDLSSVIAKANDILGAYSSAQARGASGPSPASPVPGQAGSPQPGSTSSAARSVLALPGKAAFSRSNLAQAQIRETYTGRGGGPASDLNIVVLPHLGTHFTVGANDLGYRTTYNFLVNSIRSPRLEVAGGVLYSALGGRALYRFRGPVEADVRLYDPKHPKLDLYGDVRLTDRLQLFYGERGFLNPAQKTPAFGIQASY